MGTSAPPPEEPTPSRGAPARPPLSLDVPPPIDLRMGPPPPSVVRSVRLWLVSAGAGAVAVAYGLRERTEVRAALRETARQADPGISASSLDDVVDLTLYGTLVAVTVVVLLEVALALGVRWRLAWARVLLALVGVVVVPVVVLADGFLSTDVPLSRDYGRLALWLQVVAALIALVLLFVPSANAWFARRRHAPDR